MAYSGKYRPTNIKKYKGNPTNIWYRSLWERKFMVYCDQINRNIIQWSSEEIWIPYRSPIDRKIHKYYPDFQIKVVEKDNTIKTKLIEIKPANQCVIPKQSKKQSKKSYLHECKTYAVNMAKWKAGKEYCKDRAWEFQILTEKELGIR